jgi:putative solute:sodium symporter small subunit
MADLTEEQKWLYRRYNMTLASFPSSIWFGVTNLFSGRSAGRLNQLGFSGFTSGYHVTARGSLAIFVVGIALHAHLGKKLDVEYSSRLEVLKTDKDPLKRSLRD